MRVQESVTRMEEDKDVLAASLFATPFQSKRVFPTGQRTVPSVCKTKASPAKRPVF